MSLFPEINSYSIVNPLPVEDDCAVEEHIEKYNALLSYYMHIPFPECLDEITWALKVRQLEWLLESGNLPVRKK